MDATILSRLQFAAATYFHFLFVPLTLGLSILLAIMETRYVRTGDISYKRMAQFWGRIFLINFTVGVVTGITLEFQFGTNWSRYSRYVGDLFGPLLAIEATVAFFLESTFIAVWALGWNRLSARTHALVIWLIAIASSLSAVWILFANSWMQHPVGYAMKDGRPVLSDFLAVIGHKYAWLTIFHTITAAYVVAGFFVMGVSAYHILRRQYPELFHRSFRMGLAMALICSLLVLLEGHEHAANLAEAQPAKMAALESHWKTQKNAPIYLLAIPDEANSRNRVEIGPIPNALSILVYLDPNAEVKGLADVPAEQRPPVMATFVSFRLMVGLGTAMLLLALAAWWRRNRLDSSRSLLRLLFWSIPIPYLTVLLGWTVTEVGRQPWIVYGLLRTSAASSPIAGSQVLFSFIAFVLLYTLIGVIAFWLMARWVRTGPQSLMAADKKEV
jgi:cytochrome d ubiquinol oxidase subunit I